MSIDLNINTDGPRRPRRSNPSAKLPDCFWHVGVPALTLFAVAVVYVAANGPVFDATGGQQPDSTRPAVAVQLGTGDPGQGRPLLCIDLAAYQEMSEAALAQGRGDLKAYSRTRDELVDQGRAFTTDNPTRVEVIDRNEGLVRVRMSEGRHAGEAGWISGLWVRGE